MENDFFDCKINAFVIHSENKILFEVIDNSSGEILTEFTINQFRLTIDGNYSIITDLVYNSNIQKYELITKSNFKECSFAVISLYDFKNKKYIVEINNSNYKGFSNAIFIN